MDAELPSVTSCDAYANSFGKCTGWLVPALLLWKEGITTSAAIGMDLFPTESWRDLYQTAIHEADLTKLPKRIADAETALVIRARDLFYASGDKIEEERVWTMRCASFTLCVVPCGTGRLPFSGTPMSIG